MNGKIPQYLYKYMDIETLALILANKTIRLNSLSTMDDLQEEKTADQAQWGRLCFVSCWTAEKQEMIPLWKMYCSKYSGVRLKLPSSPFKTHTYSEEEIAKCKASYGALIYPVPKGSIPIKYFQNSEILPLDTHDVFLQPIKYSNKREDLYPQIIYHDSVWILDIGKLGTTKNKYWKFQKEWRYIIPCMPTNFDEISAEAKEASDLAENIKNYHISPTNHFDINLCEDAFTNAEVMLAPDISVGNRLIVEQLCKSHNIKFVQSKLSGLVR